MTVGLAMITNDAEATIALLEKYGQYFDKWFITVADKDKKQYKKLEGYSDKLVLSYFKWCDSFGKARIANQATIDTDYWFWIDSDDEIEGIENLPVLLEQMKAEDLDAIYMRYDYMKNDLGESTGDHWRERLIRTKSALQWADTRCHETLLAPNAATARSTDMTILHNKGEEELQKSLDRNIKLLELDFKDTEDPRIALYLGDNYVARKEFDKALEKLTFLLQNGNWDEDKYRAWLKVAEIFMLQQRYADALNACYAAEELKPDWPDAFFLKASIYAEMQKPLNVYENVKTAVLKGKPTTLSVTNPTLYEYKGLFLGAIAAAELGKVNESFKMLQAVLAKSPDYKPAKDLLPIIEESYYDGQAVDKLKWLLFYLKESGGDPEKFLTALPERILTDPRLNFVRSKLIKPKQWPEKSIVFYCGKSTEAWGPDTLAKGMGGSEEAIVYLTRELARLGWQVTVYNDRETQDTFDGVDYKPWQLLNPNDTFDVFVAWRAPSFTRGVKARIKAVDLHDTPIGHQTVTDDDVENTDLYFFKSKFQTEYAPNIPKEKIVIVGNGIKGSQFNG